MTSNVRASHRTRYNETYTERTSEPHRPGSIGWLRAAVPGANDGIVSTASLIIGAVDYSRTCGNVASLAGSPGRGWRPGQATPVCYPACSG